MIISDKEFQMKGNGSLSTQDCHQLVNFVDQFFITFTLWCIENKQQKQLLDYKESTSFFKGEGSTFFFITVVSLHC